MLKMNDSNQKPKSPNIKSLDKIINKEIEYYNQLYSFVQT